jgi:hypothetical protein
MVQQRIRDYYVHMNNDLYEYYLLFTFIPILGIFLYRHIHKQSSMFILMLMSMFMIILMTIIININIIEQMYVSMLKVSIIIVSRIHLHQSLY